MPTIDTPSTRTIAWLMAGDPAIRWQVLRDLVDAPASEVREARARVATEGLSARLLAMQTSDGLWGGVAWNRGWSSTMHALILLREFGVDPDDPRVRAAVDRVHAHVTWTGCAPPECDGNGFFAGEVEPCINGQVAASGAYFRQDVHALVARLTSERLADGGWNCDAEFGSTRSSFNTTLCVLEALHEYRQTYGADASVATALARGHEYLLERRLFRRRSTGEVIAFDRKMGAESQAAQPSFTRFAFPTWWHYDVLWALDYLRRAGVPPDPRLAEAVQLVAGAAVDGRWSPAVTYAGEMLVDLGERDGQPSRWLTLRALRVLRWHGQTR